VRERLGLPKDAAICLHAGNMGYKQNLENVIECARLAAERDGRLLFVLMGDGNRRSYLEGLAGQYKLPNVCFLPLQSKALFPNALAAADLLLVNQRGTVGDMSLPGKLTAYFVSGQPVIAAVARDSETAREVAVSGAGVVVEPDDPGALLDAIEGLLGDPAKCDRLGAAGKRFAREKLTPSAALTDYEAFIQALLPADCSDGRPTLRAAA
jgi:glycosyltransferase involved in cell wall biosynthesis